MIKRVILQTTVKRSGPGNNFRWKYKNVHELHENLFVPLLEISLQWRCYKYLNNKYEEEIMKAFIKVGSKCIIRIPAWHNVP